MVKKQEVVTDVNTSWDDMMWFANQSESIQSAVLVLSSLSEDVRRRLFRFGRNTARQHTELQSLFKRATVGIPTAVTPRIAPAKKPTSRAADRARKNWTSEDLDRLYRWCFANVVKLQPRIKRTKLKKISQELHRDINSVGIEINKNFKRIAEWKSGTPDATGDSLTLRQDTLREILHTGVPRSVDEVTPVVNPPIAPPEVTDETSNLQLEQIKTYAKQGD